VIGVHFLEPRCVPREYHDCFYRRNWEYQPSRSQTVRPGVYIAGLLELGSIASKLELELGSRVGCLGSQATLVSLHASATVDDSAIGACLVVPPLGPPILLSLLQCLL
jgi:hypothetical protein